MFWIVLAILIIVVWIIYSIRKVSVTLNKDQAEIVGELCRIEQIELEKKMQDMVDKDALQGKTVPVESIGRVTADMSEDMKKRLLTFKQGLLDKYGPTIPINTAHRISWEMEGNGKMWSDSPGCFERHLQRRDGNPLFPSDRRIVTRKEIEDACEKDKMEQQQFKEKTDIFLTNTMKVIKGKLLKPDEVSPILEKVMGLIEEAMSIGGNVANVMEGLDSLEETLMQSLNKTMPEGVELLKKAHALSCLKRIPYMAQSSRKNSPILKEEEIPALLSEDLNTISLEGNTSRAFAPNYRPNEADIKTHLDVAIGQGFSKDRAREIIAAWNQNK